MSAGLDPLVTKKRQRDSWLQKKEHLHHLIVEIHGMKAKVSNGMKSPGTECRFEQGRAMHCKDHFEEWIPDKLERNS